MFWLIDLWNFISFITTPLWNLTATFVNLAYIIDILSKW